MKRSGEVLPEISIIIPTYNEEKYITKCLDSIIENISHKESIEIILVDGLSSDATVEIIEAYQKKYSFISLIKNPRKIAPVAMNLGIVNAKGKYIFIISAHASYTTDYFINLVSYLEKLEVECVGPVLNTQIRKKTDTSNAIKNVLSDKLGVGSTFRTGIKEIQEVDTVPFGCYKREVFDKIGLYDERLVRNQDIELNKRLQKAGGKIYIIPQIQATYFARETFKELAKNNFANGKWNILTAYFTKTFSSLSLRHFVPLLFISGILLPLFCCYQFSIAILSIYCIVIIIRSIKIRKETDLLHQVIAFVVLHFSYGIGELTGVFSLLKIQLQNVYHKMIKKIIL